MSFDGERGLANRVMIDLQEEMNTGLIVFTLANGWITRIEDHRLRAEALRSDGTDDPGWR
jgi:hypothetical protein